MSVNEDEITAWFEGQDRLNAVEFPIGIGDDMAEVRIGDGGSVLITTDMLLDGVHFDLKEVSLEQVGYKAMAVSLSDCAAMATRPVAAVVSVAMPKEFGEDELKKLHKGIISAGEKYGCKLVGGDITSWKNKGPFAISVAMLSRAGSNKPVRRNGAEVGDCICVTGELGGSRLGRHMDFEPRVFEAIKLAQMVKINSMIDVSDGVSSDLNRICQRSGVGAIIEAEEIPVSKAAGKGDDPLSAALNDGEDFELLFTVSQPQWEKLVVNWKEPLEISRIGRITDTKKMQIKGV
ncbi:MAG: thiamine-phosphate kinase, partial [Planctomycetota bacterium]